MALPFIEIIEDLTPDPNLLMWKFADADKEIKNGAVLTVRESQAALFLNEGKLADIFTPGRYVLKTENIPLLTSLKGWKYGFDSPFKADVYFFNTMHFAGQRWGTPTPVLMRDPTFGQVRVRAFGTFNVRINDFAKFFRQYAGTSERLTITELEYQLRDYIAPMFGEVLAQANISVLDIAGNISALNEKIQPLIQPYFTDLGVEVTRFAITGATLPDEVLKHYDNVTSINMITDMDKFTKFNLANAMEKGDNKVADAAQQALALSVMLNQMPAATPQQEDIPGRLKKLKGLFDAQLITETEYATKKEELLRLL
jgi:membrane protease subunit (stomatin/prohibitin family)